MMETQGQNLQEDNKLDNYQTPEKTPVESETKGEKSVSDTEEQQAETNREETVTKEVEKTSDENTDSYEETKEETVTPLDAATLAAITKPEIVERLERIISEPKKYLRTEADALKQAYYRIRRTETESAKKEFLENGGEEKDFKSTADEYEAKIKNLVTQYKEKRAALAAEEERQKEANLLIKQNLIDRLKALTESQDDFNKRYNEFREIQRKWKEVGAVPQEHAKEIWRNYQLYNEQFYDIVKINNQFRDYDFKKNMELKTSLCEIVERIQNEPDAISAFHQLQKLHQQWREIGPVAKEFRESIWERFKAASTVINKRYQAHFEEQKENEEKNLAAKTEICDELEKIDFDNLKTKKDWDKHSEKVLELQAKWRTIGFATKKESAKIYERYRTACDNYFHKKNEFYKVIKQDMEKNLGLKKALVEKAESLKESTNWIETTKAFVNLQNEWKKIGPVARKYSETIWKQFIAACDYFFEQKNKALASVKNEEAENLNAKKALIEKINTLDESLSDEDALNTLKNYITEWGQIGFVPIKEKNNIYKAFREATDKQFDRLKISERDRKMQQFRSSITELAEIGKGKLFSERDKLMRTFDRMKSELQTYENNIGFFNVSSKGGGGMLKEMERKIAKLKEDMEIIVKKIEAIDENLDKKN